MSQPVRTTMNESAYTMVICTCDSYADTWGPLFTLFDRYWAASRALPIVLNTETAEYERPPFRIVCPRLYADHPDPRSVPWSRRLRETITLHVKTDLVLIYLDDFYLRGPVNTERLDICVAHMGQHPEVANISLFVPPKPYTPTAEHPWLAVRSKKAPYLFNLQAGLWRTKRLLHFLRDHESPWYFERWGSVRARRYPDTFMATVSVAEGVQPIFDYDPGHEGLSKGKWLPQTPALFAREGIVIDLNIRGILDAVAKEVQARQYRRSWLRSAWNIFRSLRP